MQMGTGRRVRYAVATTGSASLKARKPLPVLARPFPISLDGIGKQLMGL